MYVSSAFTLGFFIERHRPWPFDRDACMMRFSLLRILYFTHLDFCQLVVVVVMKKENDIATKQWTFSSASLRPRSALHQQPRL